MKQPSDTVAIVLLENVWWTFKKNPEFASAEPFFEGLARYNDSARCYRLNFFDESSFRKALEFATTVPEKRVVLHIGAHGDPGRIGGVRAEKLLSHLASVRRQVEGVILSCCSAGNNGSAIQRAFEGKIRWLFTYMVDIDWLGSMLIDTCILEEVCREQSSAYADSASGVVKTLNEALTKFNPAWLIDDVRKDRPLKDAISLWVKPARARLPIDATEELTAAAWQ